MFLDFVVVRATAEGKKISGLAGNDSNLEVHYGMAEPASAANAVLEDGDGRKPARTEADTVD